MDRRIATILAEQLGSDWIVAPHGSSAFCSTWSARAVSRSTAGERLFV